MILRYPFLFSFLFLISFSLRSQPNCPFDQDSITRMLTSAKWEEAKTYIFSESEKGYTDTCGYLAKVNVMNYYIHSSSLDEALHYFKNLSALEESRTYSNLYYKTATSFTSALVNGGRNQELDSIFNIIYPQVKKPEVKIQLLTNKAIAKNNEKKYDESIQLLLQAYDIYHDNKITDEIVLLNLKNQHAISLINARNYSKALNLFNDVIVLAKRNERNTSMSYYYLCRAFCHGSLEYREQEKADLDSAELYIEYDPGVKGFLYTNQSASYARFGSTERALEYSIKAKEELKKAGKPFDLFTALKSVIFYSLKLEKYDILPYVKEVKQDCSSVLDRYDSLYIEQWNHISNTALYDKKLAKASNSIFHKWEKYYDNEIQVSNNETIEKYEADKKEAANKLLLKQQELDKATISKQYAYLGGLGGALFSFVVLGYSLYRRSREKSKHNEELVAKNHKIQALNREITHRTKNYLNLARALISKNKSQTTDENVISALEENEHRMRVLASINHRLTDDHSHKDIPIKSFLKEIMDDLVFSFTRLHDTKTEAQLKVDDIDLDADASLYLGLITNELITNSFKHAVAGKEGLELEVELSKSDDKISYTYNDNGKKPMEASDRNSDGMSLVSDLMKQLNGSFKTSWDGGYRMVAEFPLR